MIKEDKSYLTRLDEIALEQNIARLGIYHLAIDRAYDEKAIPANRDKMTDLEWMTHCDKVREGTGRKIEELLRHLAEEFQIYQLDGRDAIPYKSDWDLFFWCNSRKGERDYSYVTLGRNDKRTLEAQLDTFEKAIRSIVAFGYEDLDIRIQRTAVYDDKKIKNMAEEQYEKIRDSYINYQGFQGKVREVGNNGAYGFFPKWSRSKYYQVSNLELALMGK
ncbi:MAG: hypothetical protein PHY15_06735 [Eubacteriales bacterium]|nr:hypothetical protein [Eubacteriales bacterium]